MRAFPTRLIVYSTAVICIACKESLEADQSDSQGVFKILDQPAYRSLQTSLPYYDAGLNRDKRFWSYRYWPALKNHRYQWKPVHKKLDQYRFMMKGLGKRGADWWNDREPEIPGNNEGGGAKQIICKNCDKFIEAIRLTNSDERSGSESPWQTYLVSTKRYMDILDSLDKRAPEIYSQDLYPIQDGTQRMEVELDRKLDNLMEDDALSANTFIDTDMNVDEEDLNSIENIEPDIDYSDRERNGIYIIDDLKMPLKEEKKDSFQGRSKKWWAARRLKLSGLKTPKSVRGHWYQRGHIDPVLYLIGLGR